MALAVSMTLKTMLADFYDISIDEIAGRVEKNVYNELMELVIRFSVNDIPKDEEDEISTIVSRYLLFTHSINLDASETLRGLTEFFLVKRCRKS